MAVFNKFIITSKSPRRRTTRSSVFEIPASPMRVHNTSTIIILRYNIILLSQWCSVGERRNAIESHLAQNNSRNTNSVVIAVKLNIWTTRVCVCVNKLYMLRDSREIIINNTVFKN